MARSPGLDDQIEHALIPDRSPGPLVEKSSVRSKIGNGTIGRSRTPLSDSPWLSQQDLTREFDFHQLCGSRIGLDSEVLSLLRLRRYGAEDREQQGSQGAFRDSAIVIVLGS